jgi:uroporphyrinogen III methyltransferase / synthase
MALKPLVVITKPKASPLAALLTANGYAVVCFPTIEIQPLPFGTSLGRAASRLKPADWVIFTSQRGVAAVFADPTSAAIAACRTAAVGEATAQALRQHGQPAHFVPQSANAVALATALHRQHNLQGQQVLLCLAENARAELASLLQSFGAIVTVIPVYRTVTRSWSGDDKARFLTTISARPVIYTFASPSALTGFIDLLDEQATTLLETAQVVTIGPTTSQHAAVLGVRVDQIAKKTSLEGMVEAVLACRHGISDQSPL